MLLPACEQRQSAPDEEDAVLTYAALNPITEDLENLVRWFDSTHEGIRLEILDYSDEGGLERLRVELALGQVPDLMEMHRYGKTGAKFLTSAYYANQIPGNRIETEGEYWMPYRQMAKKGYLEDLWPYIESDPELSRDGVLQAPLKAVEADGGLYVLFRKTVLFTLTGRERVVGNRNGWTLDELMEVYSGMPEGSTILRYNLTKQDVFYNLIRFSLERYVDRETGACFFDGQGFRDLVLFLDGFPDEAGQEDPAERDGEIIRRMRDEKQMLEGYIVTWPQCICKADSIWQESAAFPGYPTADGSSGNFFYPVGTILAMSSACRDKSAAWDVIYRSLLKPVLSRSRPLETFECIPVNLHDYELTIWGDLRNADAYLRNFPYLLPGHFKTDVKIPMLHILREEDAQRYRELVDNTTQLYWPEDELSDIVWETLGAYFAGDRTLDNTIALLNNRVGVYLNEQK